MPRGDVRQAEVEDQRATPTAKRIKELLEPVILVRYPWNEVRHRAVNELTWVQRIACLLLEIPPHRLAGGPSG